MFGEVEEERDGVQGKEEEEDLEDQGVPSVHGVFFALSLSLLFYFLSSLSVLFGE